MMFFLLPIPGRGVWGGRSLGDASGGGGTCPLHDVAGTSQHAATEAQAFRRVRHTQGIRPRQAMEFDWDPHGFPNPAWRHLLPAFRGLDRELSLALPCCGIDACSQALRIIGVPFRVAYACDTAPWLAAPLTGLHGSAADHFHIGVVGDLRRMEISQWSRVDGIVSGPPCPPFSAIGRRAEWADSRAKVFQRVTDVLVDQGWKGALFFIVEMVEGMAHQRHGETHGHRPRGISAHAEWLAELAERAPMWDVHTWRLNTRDYLPQNRPRLYTVGVNRNTGCRTPLPPCPPPASWRPSLASILHTGMQAIQEKSLSTRLTRHLEEAKARVHSRVSAAHGDIWAAISLDRDPDRKWHVSTRLDCSIGTLRTKHELEWILHWRDGVLTTSRCLHCVEHLSLQGFPPELAQFFANKRDLVQAAGNACSVPVLGAVLVQVLHASPLALPPSPGRQLDDLAGRRKREREEAIRADIAQLQAQSAAYKKERHALEME